MLFGRSAYVCRPQQAGFTLLEGLIALSIIATVAALTLPDLVSLRQQRVAMLTNNLTTAVQTARAQALYYRANTFICPSANGSSCSSDWNQAHILVMLSAGAARSQKILYTLPMPIMPGKLTWRGFGTNPCPQMNPSGDSFQYNGTWQYCSDNPRDLSDNRTISLSATGKVSVIQGRVCS